MLYQTTYTEHTLTQTRIQIKKKNKDHKIGLTSLLLMKSEIFYSVILHSISFSIVEC